MINLMTPQTNDVNRDFFRISEIQENLNKMYRLDSRITNYIYMYFKKTNLSLLKKAYGCTILGGKPIFSNNLQSSIYIEGEKQ